MRVITGTAKGRKLKSPAGLDTRPTSDAVKEAIFSAIQFEIGDAVVADLFAGSGQLGIEALSRGAKEAYFSDSASANLIRENIEHCGFEKISTISSLSVAAFLKKTEKSFDIAFLDPPYEKGLIPSTLKLLVPKMNEGGIIVCEHERGLSLPQKAENFELRKTYNHGKKSVTIYRCEG